MSILKKLLFSTVLTFTKLSDGNETPSNQFTFHINQLIRAGLVVKSRQKYSLSNKGKLFANRMDTESKQIIRQAKIGVLICPMKVEKNKENEYLFYTRLKHPFYGCQGFITGKVLYGEKIIETARRELFEETGLEGTPELISIHHSLNIDSTTNELLEDKIFHKFRVINPHGKLRQCEEGRYKWVKESNIEKFVTKPFYSLESTLKSVESVKNFSGGITFDEKAVIVSNF